MDQLIKDLTGCRYDRKKRFWYFTPEGELFRHYPQTPEGQLVAGIVAQAIFDLFGNDPELSKDAEEYLSGDMELSNLCGVTKDDLAALIYRGNSQSYQDRNPEQSGGFYTDNDINHLLKQKYKELEMPEVIEMRREADRILFAEHYSGYECSDNYGDDELDSEDDTGLYYDE